MPEAQNSLGQPIAPSLLPLWGRGGDDRVFGSESRSSWSDGALPKVKPSPMTLKASKVTKGYWLVISVPAE